MNIAGILSQERLYKLFINCSSWYETFAPRKLYKHITLPPSRSVWCMKKIDLVYFANLIWHQELMFHSRKSYLNQIWRWLERGGYMTVWMKEAMNKCQESITSLSRCDQSTSSSSEHFLASYWPTRALTSDWLSHFPYLNGQERGRQWSDGGIYALRQVCEAKGYINPLMFNKYLCIRRSPSPYTIHICFQHSVI